MNPYSRLQGKNKRSIKVLVGSPSTTSLAANSCLGTLNFRNLSGIKIESSEVLFGALLIPSFFTARLCRAHEITFRVGLGTLVFSASLMTYLIDRQIRYDLSTPREGLCAQISNLLYCLKEK